ncbi:hypothetical protein DFP88_10548 [Pseudoroseicyclus aestuarii]|uniref:Uncharacterized protein n=1 Tax=Pseudoroseicyclus aestuarii TaxID=1795041 RepID=A0A318SPF0_9RHOB|nr:hypothetical protein DFP88_10548 [Pseudoroseicyclus aestuarii]
MTTRITPLERQLLDQVRTLGREMQERDVRQREEIAALQQQLDDLQSSVATLIVALDAV